MSQSERGAGAGALAPIGILGGTFDPVHLGHLRLAEEAREMLNLQQVIWIPAGQPPLRTAPGTDGAHRLAMVAAAIAGQPDFVLDDAEVRAPQASYTVHTLQRLRDLHDPAQPLVLLLGADAFARLEGWFEWRRLFELAHIAVATRTGHDLGQLGAGSTALDNEFSRRRADASALTKAPAGAIVPFVLTALDISATNIRARLAGGASVRYLVTEPVLDYIQRHHLYA